MQLIKKLVVLNKGKSDEKKFYTLFVRLENGTDLQVDAHSYRRKDGTTKSNYDTLVALASYDLPFDK